MPDSLEHGSHGSMADLTTRLMNGSKWYGQKLCIFHVVDAHDLEILGYPPTERKQALHETTGGPIVHAHKTVRAKLFEQLLQRSVLDRGQALNQPRFRLEAVGEQRLTKPDDPGFHSRSDTQVS